MATPYRLLLFDETGLVGRLHASETGVWLVAGSARVVLRLGHLLAGLRLGLPLGRVHGLGELGLVVPELRRQSVAPRSWTDYAAVGEK